jgi:hypothetical protein
MEIFLISSLLVFVMNTLPVILADIYSRRLYHRLKRHPSQTGETRSLPGPRSPTNRFSNFHIKPLLKQNMTTGLMRKYYPPVKNIKTPLYGLFYRKVWHGFLRMSRENLRFFL